MNDGLRSRSGEPSPGLRELLERLRRARQERLERHDLGGVYDEIARELDDIIDEERHAIDRDRLEARQMSERTGDPRRSEVADAAAEERLFRLDLLPDDLAGKVAELQRYDFTSASAEGRLEALLERLRAQLANQMFESMSGAMQQMTPESVGRMKDMMAALNEMLERQRRGEDPGFEEFMERYGDFFPEQPETLDELLESLAKRMAAMQAMLNSMTPEQRAQLQELAEQLLGDLDLQWQMDRLGSNLRALAPGEGWDASYDFNGNDPLGLAEAMQAMAELGELDQLEGLLRGVSAPTALAEADMDRVRDLLGDDAARALQRLSELTRQLTEAGLIEQTEAGLQMTPRGIRAIGANALRDLFAGLTKDQLGQHQLPRLGLGHESAGDTKPYEYGDPFRLDLHRTLRNALLRRSGDARRPDGHAGATRARRLRDRAHRAPHPLVDGADARPVDVDADGGSLRAGEEGGDGPALAHQHAVPARLPRRGRVLRDGEGHRARADPGGELGLRVRHEHAPRVHARPSPARPSVGNAVRSSWSPTASRPLTSRPMVRCSSTTRRRARPSRRRCARCCGAPGPGSASTRSCSVPRPR